MCPNVTALPSAPEPFALILGGCGTSIVLHLKKFIDFSDGEKNLIVLLSCLNKLIEVKLWLLQGVFSYSWNVSSKFGCSPKSVNRVAVPGKGLDVITWVRGISDGYLRGRRRPFY